MIDKFNANINKIDVELHKTNIVTYCMNKTGS